KRFRSSTAAPLPNLTQPNQPTEMQVPEIETIRNLPFVKVDNKFRCKAWDCPLMFDQVNQFNEHYSSHTKLFKCQKCSNLFLCKSRLYRHYLENHRSDKRPAKVSAPR